MREELDDTVALSVEELDAMGVAIEEEDESGAPEKVAWPKTDDAHPLESADELREPPYEGGEDVTESTGATPDLEERVQDES